VLIVPGATDAQSPSAVQFCAHVLDSGCQPAVPPVALQYRVREPYSEPVGQATVASVPALVVGHTPDAGQSGAPHAYTSGCH
jgi:hypothetical protein